jgi:hypothetical protein
MKRVVISALLLVPAAALAASAFDGTWKTRMDSFKITGKPDVFQIVDGVYDCSSCAPEIKVKADGTDQKVTGHSYYDSVAVKVVDAHTVEIAQRKAGKDVFTSTNTVSADGNVLSGKFTDHTGAQVATGSFSSKRVAAGPAGSHAVSGSWQLDQAANGNEALRTYMFKMTPDQFSMHWNGQSYDAKFDGKEYPVAGDSGHTHVTLKRIDDNTVEEVDHRDGKVTDEIRLAAAKDGKTLDITDRDVQHAQTVTYTLEKQ